MSVATVLKSRWTVTPVMGLLALSAAILAGLLLAGLTEAQEVEDQAGMNTTTVVGPGESLWTIAQARLGPEVSSQQVAAEAERIYGLNRDRIGDDPNFVQVGQEIFVSPASVDPVSVGGEQSRTPEEPAAASEAEQVSATPAVPPTEQAATDTAASSEQPAEEELPAEAAAEGNEEPAEEPATKVAAEPAAEEEPFSSEPEGVGVVGGVVEQRQMLGLATLLLTVVLAILMAWKLPLNRNVERGWSPYSGRLWSPYYPADFGRGGEEYSLPRQPTQEEKEGEEQVTEVEASEQADVGTSISGTSADPATNGPADLSESETILLSKAFLEGCLEERLGQEEKEEEEERPVLDPREREFLELVAVSATFRDEIVVPKELLEAFLAKN